MPRVYEQFGSLIIDSVVQEPLGLKKIFTTPISNPNISIVFRLFPDSSLMTLGFEYYDFFRFEDICDGNNLLEGYESKKLIDFYEFFLQKILQITPKNYSVYDTVVNKIKQHFCVSHAEMFSGKTQEKYAIMFYRDHMFPANQKWLPNSMTNIIYSYWFEEGGRNGFSLQYYPPYDYTDIK